MQRQPAKGTDFDFHAKENIWHYFIHDVSWSHFWQLLSSELTRSVTEQFCTLDLSEGMQKARPLQA